MSKDYPLRGDAHRWKMTGPKAAVARNRASTPTVANSEPRDPPFIPVLGPHKPGSLLFPAPDKWNPLLALARIFSR